ncbi:single-stranded DNA-binding protein [Arthrobacter sp. ERGS1:01]|uniref:single-stranded DNA-binding protein n=1 Tax=Arthrobacter sp. ERGS1:01 TaxID=1704044 RepID=UPI0006B6955F|nr:single-stranded DNA-binding protein [Arthrobacter sp. ERGS1:01]
MANFLTIRGFVCSAVEVRTTASGLVVGHFRMGSTHRRQDPITNVWADGDTNWFRINIFRALAQNAVASIHKGDRIIVVGKLHMVSYIRKDGHPGLSVEIDAESIGADLQFGTAFYARSGALRQSGATTSQYDGGTQGYGPTPATGDGTAYVAPDSAEDYGEDGDPDGLESSAAADGGQLEGDAKGAIDDATDPDAEAAPGDDELVDEETGELLKEKAPF